MRDACVGRPTHGERRPLVECRRGAGRSIVELRRDELAYDVRNTLYVYAKGQEAKGVDATKLALVHDVGEDGNKDKVARLLDMAVEDCREELYALTRREGREAYVSDSWEEVAGADENGEDGYLLPLTLPAGMSAQSIRSLAVYAHDYVVNTVAKQWLLMVYDAGAAQFAALAEEALRRMRRAAGKVARPRRIKMSVF